MPPRRRAPQGGVGAVLIVDVLALLIVLASAPAAWLWLDSWHPSPVSGATAVAPETPSPALGASGAAAGSPGVLPRPGGPASPEASLGSSPAIAYGSGTWSSLEPLPQPIWGAGTAVLRDGRVLVVGGALGSSSKLATVAVTIFDPATGHWTAATNMLAARAYPMVVTLADGSVLAVGGSANVVPLDTAERYSPDNGTWVAAGRMEVPRTQGTLTLLRDGRVLAVGGGIVGSPGWLSTASAEIYDPTTGVWSPAAPMSVPRSHQSATLLPDGEVLVAGGATTYNGTIGTVTATAEIYNPRTDTWRRAASMSVARYAGAGALLPDGRVLVAGGWSFTTNTDPSLATAEIYDPATDRWTPTGSMNQARASFSLTTLADGRLLALAGVDPSYHMLASVEVYDPRAGTWQESGALPVAVEWPVLAKLLDGRVLVAGGALDTSAGRLTAVCVVYSATPPKS
jgi:N-acetylneuraminic acid mutarotase